MRHLAANHNRYGRLTAAPAPRRFSVSVSKHRQEAGTGRDRDGGRCPGRVPARLGITGTKKAASMSESLDSRARRTFLTHFFGGGLVD